MFLLGIVLKYKVFSHLIVSASETKVVLWTVSPLLLMISTRLVRTNVTLMLCSLTYTQPFQMSVFLFCGIY